MWGIHNDVLGAELIDQGFISVGWEKVPDLRTVGHDQETIKAFLERAYPEVKAGAIPVWAGMLRKFGYEMKVGDLVVAPSKADSTINLGRVSGGYEYVAAAPEHRHRRTVTWLRTGIPRASFPQAALFEIGAVLTLFQIKKHRAVFEAALSPSKPVGGGIEPPADIDGPRSGWKRNPPRRSWSSTPGTTSSSTSSLISPRRSSSTSPLTCCGPWATRRG